MKKILIIKSILMVLVYQVHWETYLINKNTFDYKYKLLSAFALLCFSLLSSFILSKKEIKNWFYELCSHLLMTTLGFALFQGFIEDYLIHYDLSSYVFSMLVAPTHYLITPFLLNPTKSFILFSISLLILGSLKAFQTARQ